jgi:CheY-like chemotaxis protein
VQPGLDGYRLAERLHAPGVPVLALTGLAGAEPQRRCLEAGFNYTLVKPFPPDALQTALEVLAREKAKALR